MIGAFFAGVIIGAIITIGVIVMCDNFLNTLDEANIENSEN